MGTVDEDLLPPPPKKSPPSSGADTSLPPPPPKKGTGFRSVTPQKSAPSPTKPMEVQGVNRHANSWENLGTFIPQTVVGGLQKDIGQAAEFLSSKLTPNVGTHNPYKENNGLLLQLAHNLEGAGKEKQESAQQYQLPRTTAGGLVSTAAHLTPDILELALTPEVKVAELGKVGEVLGKYGGKYAPKVANALTGKFPTLMATKGLTSGYVEAKDKGATDEEANKAGLKKMMGEYAGGVLMEGASAGAGELTKYGTKAMEDAGWMSKGKLLNTAQRSLMHSAAQGAAFSVLPFATNAIEGKPTSMDDVKQSGVFGALLGALHLPTDEGEPKVSDMAAKHVLENTPLIDLHNFMQSDMDGIKQAHNLEATAGDLELKSAADAQKAFQSSDPEEKQQAVVSSGLNGKLSSVKSVTNAILQDKDAVLQSIDDLPIPEEQKQSVRDKIESVHKELDPTEQHKTALGEQIRQKDESIAKLGEKASDPVKQAENEVGLEQAKKDREELNNELKNVILKQKENEKTKNGGQGGQSAANPQENETARPNGENEPTVQNGGENDEGRQNLTKPVTGEVKAEPVIKETKPEDVTSAELKGKEYKSEPMSPTDYIRDSEEAAPGKPIDPKIVNQVKEAIQKGEPIEPLTLTYDKEGNVTAQDGRHRAQAAIDLGIKQVPVVKIEGELPNATKTRQVEKGSQGEHIGISQGANVPENEEEIRQGKSKETGNRGGLQPKEERVNEKATKTNAKSEATESGEGAKGGEGSTGIPGGGDRDVENEKAERVKPTSIKKVITEATRQEKGLPDVELSKFKGDSPTLELGKKLVGTGAVKPDEVIDRVVSGKGIYTPDEAAAMQYHMHQLAQEEANLRDQLSDVDKKLESLPNDEQHKKARELIIGNLRQLDDRTEEATRANRINSRSWSNLGNVMQIEADSSFSPANVRSIIRDNYGGTIPKDVQARIDSAIKERDQALSDLKKATENATTKQGKQVVEKIRKSVGLVKMTKSELEAEAEQLKQDLRKALKTDFSRVNSGIPIPTETLAVMGKLAVNYFKQGVKDFEGMVNRIHDDLKDMGVDKAQVREYLSNYEPLREESKSRRVELLGRKERAIEKQLTTGQIRDYSKKPEITFKKDNEVIKAEQRVKNAEYKLKQEKQKSYNKTKSGTQRGLDWIIRWERRFVLSSPAILEKLGSAVTIGGAFRRLPEEAVGGMWTKMLPALMNKAPIEGGFNAKAEAEYWKEFSNPKKFLHNAKEILKTGASDLTKEFSDKPHEHYRYYDALTDLHPIIKDLSKRATYEASLIKGLKWAEGQGLDTADPLIRQNIKQMAYNRAEYEIFQENSGWNRRLQKFLNDDRTPKNSKEMLTRFATKFLMPVSTVPLNIARRIGNYATGLPRGLANAREAYKVGIDNLTNEQAEIIAKQLKQGTMGAALFTMGLFGIGGSYGGFYNKDDRGGIDRSGVFDPGFDEMYFGKQKVAKPVQHALPLQLIQLGATYRDIYKLYMDKYSTSDEYNSELDKQMKSTAHAAMVSAGAIAEQVPLIEEPFEMVGSLKDPYMRKKFVEGLKRRVTPTIVTDASKLIKK